MENEMQSNEEKRCIICNKPYSYHYDMFGKSIYSTKDFKS